MSRAARGVGLLEVVLAFALLAFLAWPLVSLVVGSGRSSAGATRRMMVELDLRRRLLETTGAPYDALVRSTGRTFSSAGFALAGPDLQATVGELTQDTQTRELEPGLAEVVTTLRWRDRDSGCARELAARRLVIRATFGIEHRPPPAVLP